MEGKRYILHQILSIRFAASEGRFLHVSHVCGIFAKYKKAISKGRISTLIIGMGQLYRLRQMSIARIFQCRPVSEAWQIESLAPCSNLSYHLLGNFDL